MSAHDACHGKRQWPTYTEAAREVTRIHKAYGERRMNVYRCDTCGRFHVGAREGKKIRRPRAPIDN